MNDELRLREQPVWLALCGAHLLYLIEAHSFPGRFFWVSILSLQATYHLLSTTPWRCTATLSASWRTVPWVGLAACYAWQMVTSPVLIPNHHYLLGYTSLAAIASFCVRSNDLNVWSTNCRMLLSLTMGIATLQKASSTNFTDGSYFGLMLAKGSFLPLLQSVDALSTANEHTFRAFLEKSPAPDSWVELQVWPTLGPAALGLAWVTLALEAWLTLGMALRPAHPLTAQTWRVFLVLLAPFRQELVFLCALAMLGQGVYVHDENERRKWSWLLIVMAPLTAWHLIT